MCPKLQKMSHEELLSDYIGPLRFQHNGPGSRSMKGLTGGKLRSDSTGRLSDSVVGLYGILPERGNNTVSVRQVGSGYTSQSTSIFRYPYFGRNDACSLCYNYELVVMAIV